jgi:NadR type nicotinamide-nucleotide adenylyltransferase
MEAQHDGAGGIAGRAGGLMNRELQPIAVQRVAILGAESSGKSTLAEALAAHYQTLWVPEYLREFVDTQGRTPLEPEQISIGRTQLEREALTAADERARGYLFCDTTPLMTAIYSRYIFGQVDAPLAALAAAHDYEVTLVAAPDCPWIPDGLQRVSDSVRQDIHAEVLQSLTGMGIPFLLVGGALEKRVAQVTRYLDERTRPA